MSNSSKIKLRLTLPVVVRDFAAFLGFVRSYFRRRGYTWFSKFEVVKDVVVDLLYKQRGRYARPFLHFGTISLAFFVITFGPLLLQQADEEQRAAAERNVMGISAFAYSQNFTTQQAEGVRQYRGGEITKHIVKDGETLSSIAELYGLQVSTVMWSNNLDKNAKLKPGQELDILPLDGVRHKVARGETIFSIGKRYGLEDSEVQKIVDYPYNEFLNDETFELATGQWLMVPDAVKPAETVTPVARAPIRITPDAGAVTGSGSFVWPAAGKITQGYRFYHKAYDIANRSGGPILAADSGTVVVAGWPDNSGYGNRVMIDHGNGYVTLYAHMSVIQVQPGQRVSRGNVIGQMGSTGRSTGTHVHFEIRQGSVLLDPGLFLR